MPIMNFGLQKKIMSSNHKVAKIYCENQVMYSSGNVVTYNVDKGVVYNVEVDSDVDVLSPTTFTPKKSGYNFVGWRADTKAEASVLDSMIMDTDPIVLYAVFEKPVTLTYYEKAQSSGKKTNSQYYNNNNVVNPKFSVSLGTYSGWSKRGWSTSKDADAKKIYDSTITQLELSEDLTIYGIYQQEVVLTYYNDDPTPSKKSGIRYYNSFGNCENPTFNLVQSDKQGWSKRGWSSAPVGNASIVYDNNKDFVLEANATLYGMYQQNITVTYYDNSTSAKKKTGTRYYNSNGNIVNPTFILSQSTKANWIPTGWSTSDKGDGKIECNDGDAFSASSNIILYGMYYRTCTLTCVSYNSKEYVYGNAYYNSSGNVSHANVILPDGAAYNGWTIRGWSHGGDVDADASVWKQSGEVGNIGTSDYTVYCLYKQTVTCLFGSYNSVQSSSGIRYYNASGNVQNATIVAPSGNGYPGWVWRGWSGAGVNTADAAVSYSNGQEIFNVSNEMLFYGLYYQETYCTFVSGLDRAKSEVVRGIRYHNSAGNTINPSIPAPTGANVPGWQWRGWTSHNSTAADAGVTYANGASVPDVSSPETHYGLYQQTITLSYNGNGSTGGSVSSHTGTRYHNSAGNYKNPSFTLKNNGFSRTDYSFTGWDLGTAGATIELDGNRTAYAQWKANPFYVIQNSAWVGIKPNYTCTYGDGSNWAVAEYGCKNNSDEYSVFTSQSWSTKGLTNVRVKISQNGGSGNVVINGTNLGNLLEKAWGEHTGAVTGSTCNIDMGLNGGSWCYIEELYFY